MCWLEPAENTNPSWMSHIWKFSLLILARLARNSFAGPIFIILGRTNTGQQISKWSTN